jgi:adenine-specific DNA-methyltransferase
MLSRISVQALDQTEDHLIFTAVTQAGEKLDSERTARLFQLPAQTKASAVTPSCPDTLENLRAAVQADLLKAISVRNAKFFEAELTKLDGWADDQIATSEKALKDIKKRLRELRNEAGKTSDLTEQARVQSDIADYRAPPAQAPAGNLRGGGPHPRPARPTRRRHPRQA